jgi:hypothetical protein
MPEITATDAADDLSADALLVDALVISAADRRASRPR